MSKLFRLLSAALTSACLLVSAPSHAQVPGVTAERILLGQSGPQTGSLSALNNDFLAGIQLYLERVNFEGGIHGRKLELLALDDAYTPERTEQNVARLINEDGVFALLGVFGTGQNQRAMPLAEAEGVPYIAPYSGAQTLREPLRPNVFHLRSSYTMEIDRIIEHLTASGITSIALIHHDDAFGATGVGAALQALQKRQQPPLQAIEAISPNGDGIKEAVARIMTNPPAAVIMITAGKTSAMVVRAFKQQSAQPMLFGLSVVSSRELLETLGKDAHGVVLAQVVPTPFRIDHPVVREYQQAAIAHDQQFSYAALEGYLAAKMTAEALQRSGPRLTRAAFTKAMESLGGFDMGGLRLQFSPTNHVGLDFIDLSVVSHGRFNR